MLQGREQVKSVVRQNLRARMVSSACTPYERDFIELFLANEANKDQKYIQQFEQRAMYLNILQNESSKQFQDFSPDQPGDFWRNEQQQRD
jgi:protoheme ferro-lyase